MDTIQTVLQDVLQPVKDLQEQLVQREGDLRLELEAVVKEKRRCEAVLKAANPPEPKPKQPESERVLYVSDEMKEKVIRAMGLLWNHEALPGQPGTFTERDLLATGVASNATIYNACQVLRKEEVIRLAGVSPETEARVYALVQSGA